MPMPSPMRLRRAQAAGGQTRAVLQGSPEALAEGG